MDLIRKHFEFQNVSIVLRNVFNWIYEENENKAATLWSSSLSGFASCSRTILCYWYELSETSITNGDH